VENQCRDIILLQELMGEGAKIVDDLVKMLKGWKFFVVDGRGQLGGLIYGCNTIPLSCAYS